MEWKSSDWCAVAIVGMAIFSWVAWYLASAWRQYKCLKLMHARVRHHLATHKIPPSHDYTHALRVLQWVVTGLSICPYSGDEHLAAQLAALLHDCDDRKYFPDTCKTKAHARRLMKEICPHLEERVIQMISYVPASENKNRMPQDEKYPDTALLAADADRLDALGCIGLLRALQVAQEKHLPLWLPTDEKVSCVEDIEKVATPERFDQYNGESKSLVGHIYDKLWQSHQLRSGNKLLQAEATQRRRVMQHVLVAYSMQGQITEDDVYRIIAMYSPK